jgi:hypothetical protein
VAPAVVGADAVVGTGGGLFAADFEGEGVGDDCITDDDCDDDDDCTDDFCVAAQCTSTPIEGIEGARCEIDTLWDLCEVTDLRTELLLEKKLTRAEILLDKAEEATKPKKQRKALKAVRRTLRGLRKKIVKAVRRGRATDTCTSAIEEAIAVVDLLALRR